MKLKVLLQALPTLLSFVSTIRADYVQTWPLGTFATYPGTFSSLDYGVNMVFNGDGNILVYVNDNLVTPAWSSGKTTPNCNGTCLLAFQDNGNLVAYYGTQPLFQTATTGQGALLVALNQVPYLFILDAAGNLVWQAPSEHPFYNNPGYCPMRQTEPWRCLLGR